MSEPGSRAEKQRVRLQTRTEKGFSPPNRGRDRLSTGAVHGKEGDPPRCSRVSGNTLKFHSLHSEASVHPMGGRICRLLANCSPDTGTSRSLLKEIRETQLHCDSLINSSTPENLKHASVSPSFTSLECGPLHSHCVCSLIVKLPLSTPSQNSATHYFVLQPMFLDMFPKCPNSKTQLFLPPTPPLSSYSTID